MSFSYKQRLESKSFRRKRKLLTCPCRCCNCEVTARGEQHPVQRFYRKCCRRYDRYSTSSSQYAEVCRTNSLFSNPHPAQSWTRSDHRRIRHNRSVLLRLTRHPRSWMSLIGNWSALIDFDFAGAFYWKFLVLLCCFWCIYKLFLWSHTRQWHQRWKSLGAQVTHRATGRLFTATSRMGSSAGIS
jgi:hypothetical protein